MPLLRASLPAPFPRRLRETGSSTLPRQHLFISSTLRNAPPNATPATSRPFKSTSI